MLCIFIVPILKAYKIFFIKTRYVNFSVISRNLTVFV